MADNLSGNKYNQNIPIVFKFPGRYYSQFSNDQTNKKGIDSRLSGCNENRHGASIWIEAKMNTQRESDRIKKSTPNVIFDSVDKRINDPGRRPGSSLAIHNRPISSLLREGSNLLKMNEIEIQERLLKLTCLYEISRVMLSIRSIDDLCEHVIERMQLVWQQCDHFFPFVEVNGKSFKPAIFPQTLEHKFFARVKVNGRVCGQVCVFYEDMPHNTLRWSDKEDAIFLQNIADDLGSWLQQNQLLDEKTSLLNGIGKMASAFDQHAIIAITDRKGKIKYVNEKFCIVSKYSAEELIGQDHRIINSGYHSKEFIRDLWNTISKGDIWKGEIKNRAKDGSYYWVDTTIVPFLDHNGSPYQYVAIRTEVTEYKRLEQKMEEQVAELARSNDELEQFAYVVTHDLQEPLRAISSFVQLLKKYCNDQLDERANQWIAHAVAGTNRMQMLIDDLLTYAQVNASQTHAQVDCERILCNVLADLSVIIGECNALISHDRLPIVKGIPFQFTQLFTNLINNALKFQRGQPPQIHVGVEESQDEWIFSVADNGIGIGEQYLERIFRVFQRLHSRKEYVGTGIGLAICKKVVEHHRGRIWVKSEPDVGSTFYFTIPKTR